LNRISIPGTHDTGTWRGSEAGDLARTQVQPLDTQLYGGIRFIDVRTRRFKGSLVIHHGATYQNQNFDDIQQHLVNFLSQNPTETVLMRLVADETTPDPTNSDPMPTMFLAAIQKYATYYYTSNSPQGTIPKLGDTRGRIVVFQDGNWNPGKLPQFLDYGLMFNKQQDDYSDDSLKNDKFGSKWDAIHAELLKSQAETDSKAWYLNFTSFAGVPYLPYTFAEKNNPQVYNFLNSTKGSNYWGVIPMDFPATPLVSLIINSNPVPKLAFTPAHRGLTLAEPEEKKAITPTEDVKIDLEAVSQWEPTDQQIQETRPLYIIWIEFENRKVPFLKFENDEKEAAQHYNLDSKHPQWEHRAKSDDSKLYPKPVFQALIHDGAILKSKGTETELFKGVLAKYKKITSAPTGSRSRGIEVDEKPTTAPLEEKKDTTKPTENKKRKTPAKSTAEEVKKDETQEPKAKRPRGRPKGTGNKAVKKPAPKKAKKKTAPKKAKGK